LRKLPIGLAAAIAVLVTAMLAAPLLIPTDFVKREIAAYVLERTGRELRIDGAVHIALLPRIAVSAEDVSLANVPNGVAARLFEVRRIDASLRFLPLLRGRIEANKVRLAAPKLNLEIDKEGRRNWVFRKPAPPDASANPAASTPGVLFAAGHVTISDGAAGYLDRRRNRQQAVANIDLAGTFPMQDGPADLQGSAAWNGETVRFAFTAASLDGLWQHGSEATIIVAAAPFNLDFKGNIALSRPEHAAGTIGVKAASLRRLLTWAKLAGRPRGADVGRLAIDGKLDAGAGKIVLAEATIEIGDTSLKGALAAGRRAGERLQLSGRLTAGRLDLAALLREAPATAPGPVLIPGSVLGPSKPAAPPPPDPTPGLAAAPVDLALLAKLDADLDLTADALRFRAFESGKTVAALHLKDGRLNLGIAEMALYGGNAKGDIAVSATGGEPNLAAKLAFSGVDMQPLLLAVSDIDAISGRGDLAIDWHAAGRSQGELVASLAGTGRIHLTDGALSGAYADPADTVVVPKLDNSANARPTEKLAYTSLSASYTISHGILTNTDLKLASPKMTATGQGFLNLPPCRVDYRWSPVIPGKGSAQIAISGPCGDLAYRAMNVTIIPPARKK
jgi:AsmA protein